nr:hypothetical protein [Tanacetum cinerariifolium]
MYHMKTDIVSPLLNCFLNLHFIRAQGCNFNISPSRFCDDDMKVCQDSSLSSSCHLCNTRSTTWGEKSFCSPECRSMQISMEEKPTILSFFEKGIIKV